MKPKSILDIVKILLQNGADINLKNRAGAGSTPLHFAVLLGKLEEVKLLVQKGAQN